jgi:hypothetical protein
MSNRTTIPFRLMTGDTGMNKKVLFVVVSLMAVMSGIDNTPGWAMTESLDKQEIIDMYFPQGRP